jgi:hypothetical protein
MAMLNFSFGSKKPEIREPEKALIRAGFEVLMRDPKKSVITNIDGKDHFGSVEADYLVRREKDEFIVFVHQGMGEIDPNEPNLRRKLLEISNAYQGKRVLFFDFNNNQLQEVKFRFPHEWGLDAFFRVLLIAFIIVLIIGIIWLLATAKLI